MEFAQISEYVCIEVPILGTYVTRSVQGWDKAVSDLILNYLKYSANCWNLITKYHEDKSQQLSDLISVTSTNDWKPANSLWTIIQDTGICVPILGI